MGIRVNIKEESLHSSPFADFIVVFSGSYSNIPESTYYVRSSIVSIGVCGFLSAINLGAVVPNILDGKVVHHRYIAKMLVGLLMCSH